MEQEFVYKGDKAELHDKDVADRMKADEGWFDNPADAIEDDKPPAAKKPEETETPDEDDTDASGMPFDAARHYKDKCTDADGNWSVKKNAK